ncbi:hypothetical protein EJ05DRAFT_470868 [Pseudovirgaria hyperparasitica]|uniref:DUF7924 domain-containing protein n=1 Tax=Pseudovirgaria hyperparasitica TaxID=470096 RepID=A0A6A6VQV6_9PEZI|nr:uncharacterized protein EJ05DRAFT_470868 [Pseudovirgaria hyperparasitica]KAF2752982.1 hypothetical protein EJ05DRAFT_470868 [Pseudovirgaria hyperparasitica]
MLPKRARDDGCLASDIPASKRRRASYTSVSARIPSPEPSPSVEPSVSLPLTYSNLRRLAEINGSIAPMPGSPTKSTSSGRSLIQPHQFLKKLNGYGISVDTGKPMPQDLKQFIAGIKENDLGLGSTTPQKVADRHRQLMLLCNEQAGIDLARPYLWIAGEANDRENGYRYLVSKPKNNLARSFLPNALEQTYKDAYGALAQPQPDDALGYVTALEAEYSGIDSAFKNGDEALLDGRKLFLANQLLFPFITAQWKTSQGEGLSYARIQSARDGPTIIRHLHTFYEKACYDTSPVRTCHFSVVCNMFSLEVYVIWREHSECAGGDAYHMEPILRTYLSDEDGVQKYRRVLRNIVEWGRTTRLDDIRLALTNLRVNEDSTSSVSATQSVNTGSSVASLPGQKPEIMVPTPPRDTSDPPKKRKTTA